MRRLDVGLSSLICWVVLTGIVALAPGAVQAELFVVDAGNDAVKAYDEETGAYRGNFVDNAGVEGGRQLLFPRGAAFGTDGSLFVSSNDRFALFRYNAIGGNLGIFANATNSPSFGSGTGVAMRNGLIYVADSTVNNVKRYDPAQPMSGAFVDEFATEGLSNPDGIAFGPDGRLYVANIDDGNILRFNGTTGALVGALSNGGSGLTGPRDLAFGPDNRLYVVDPSLPGKVLRYRIDTGVFVDFFVDGDAFLGSPRTLAWGPDERLYVGDQGDGEVRSYLANGAANGSFISPGVGGLIAPVDLFFAEPCAAAEKLVLSFHWWGILALTCLFGALHLRSRRALVNRHST